MLKLIGAAALGLIGGGLVGFALSNVLGIGLLVAGGGMLPSWAPLLRYLIAVCAALGLVAAPMLVARGGR
ncbi:DUF5957 family protein [Nocardiopsis sp. NPDC050513]|uniref:DUF5957 family protein n=1 Tax=Nocardiopsis sp. NPDC050513 TaxID=3364338 RepID=UPI00378EB7AC